MRIAGRDIGPGHATYIIAEMSCNHHQDLDQALSIVQAAAEAGCDAIKLQTYTPDTITIDCSNEHFTLDGSLWSGRNLHSLYQEVAAAHDLAQPNVLRRPSLPGSGTSNCSLKPADSGTQHQPNASVTCLVAGCMHFPPRSMILRSTS